MPRATARRRQRRPLAPGLLVALVFGLVVGLVAMHSLGGGPHAEHRAAAAVDSAPSSIGSATTADLLAQPRLRMTGMATTHLSSAAPPTGPTAPRPSSADGADATGAVVVPARLSDRPTLAATVVVELPVRAHPGGVALLCVAVLTGALAVAALRRLGAHGSDRLTQVQVRLRALARPEPRARGGPQVLLEKCVLRT